jgi:hypothetical protein
MGKGSGDLALDISISLVRADGELTEKEALGIERRVGNHMTRAKYAAISERLADLTMDSAAEDVYVRLLGRRIEPTLLERAIDFFRPKPCGK